MRRIIFSIIGGIVLPTVYLVIMGSLSDLMPPSILWDIKLYGEAVPGILFIPVAIPIYFAIFARHFHILPFIFDTPWFRISSTIAFDWILYGGVTYLFLGRFNRFKKEKREFSSPPPPPEFSEIKID